MRRTLVIGYDGGLGKLVCEKMDKVSRVVQGAFDVRIDDKIKKFLDWQPAIDNLIYCAGVNLISYFDKVEFSDFWESMDVNCWGFIRIIQVLREKHKLNEAASVCIITSNAANIPMSHSLAYNCSKSAANMAIRQMAREISAEEMMIFGVAPNKLDGTPMSRDIERKVCKMRGWTPKEALEYQLKALPAGVETNPHDLATFITRLMETKNYPYLHGTIIPYGGPQ